MTTEFIACQLGEHAECSGEFNYKGDKNRCSCDCHITPPAKPETPPTSLYQAIIAAGIPTDSHASDLYFPVTPESTAILRKFPTAARTAETFISNIEKTLWYCAHFCYDPYWNERQERKL